MSHLRANSENVEPRRELPGGVLERLADCLVLDVRTPMEFHGVKIAGAQLRPMDEVDAEEVERLAAGREIVLICQSGGRAARVAEGLKGKVTVPLTILEGGVNAWQAAGLPLERGPGRGLSLERQVRIAAGSLVLAGVAFGFLLHPGFFGMAGFVGAGLVFAGVTDTCGMGILLAKMPWNRGSRGYCPR